MTAGAPGPHPEPPANLDDWEPLIADITEPLWRIHQLIHEPIYFGKAANYRFDSPDGKYGVMYAGRDEHCAFVETLGQETGKRLVSMRALEQRGWARVKLKRTLRLVDLVSSGGLARIGADARLFAGEHAIAQRSSRALRGHRTKPDGIWYPARHDPARPAAGLFDHCEGEVEAEKLGSLAEKRHEKLLGEILDTYGYGVV